MCDNFIVVEALRFIFAVVPWSFPFQGILPLENAIDYLEHVTVSDPKNQSVHVSNSLHIHDALGNLIYDDPWSCTYCETISY